MNPVHKQGGPNGEDVKMVQHSALAGTGGITSPGPNDDTLRAFKDHEITGAISEPVSSHSPYIHYRAPSIVIYRAPDVDQTVANAPWDQRRARGRSPNLTVNDSWKIIRQRRVATKHSGQSLVCLRQNYVVDPALESRATKRQTEANYSAALARHQEYLTRIEELQSCSDRASLQTSHIEAEKEATEPYVGSIASVLYSEIAENVLFAAPIVEQASTPLTRHQNTVEYLQEVLSSSRTGSPEQVISELPTTTPVVELSDSTVSELPPSALVLPELGNLDADLKWLPLFADDVLGAA